MSEVRLALLASVAQRLVRRARGARSGACEDADTGGSDRAL